MKLETVQYNYNKKTGYNEDTRKIRFLGFIAQQFQKIFPEMVGETTIDDKTYLDSNLSSLPVYIIKAMQEQQEIIENIKSENSELRKELEEIKVLLNNK